MLLAANDPSSLEFGAIVMGLFGGLALFLFGMDQMAEALKLVAGDGMKRVLAGLTSNRFTGVLAGTFVTAIIQSSSVTTVLVVGFISAGLMTLSQSIGVILGADIGTTITAQIVAFKVTKYALVLVTIGFILLFGFKSERIRHYGHIVMGLGLIFFGMHLMSEAARPLRTYPPFIELMQDMNNPLLAMLVAAAFTGLVQSSSATIGIVIALASQGLISLQVGIALAFGANIGTCITALLAAIGKPREAVRAAMVHVLFKVVGVLLWIGFIDQLAALVTAISPTHEQLQGIERLAAESPRQIANAHTVFNVANAFLFIWFTGPLARLMYWLVPERKVIEPEKSVPKYLDTLLLQTPSLAMDTVRMELGRLGASAIRMFRGALDTVIHGDAAQLNDLEQMDNVVDRLHGAIVTYLGRLSQENLSDRQSEQLHDYLAAANYIENIGDMVETNIVETGRERLRKNLRVSKATEEIFTKFHHKVSWAVERSVRALVDNDGSIAAEVTAAKDEINRLSEVAESHLTRRLAADEPARLATFRLESELIEYLKRVYYFAKRIAKIVSEEDLAYRRKPSDAAEEVEETVSV